MKKNIIVVLCGLIFILKTNFSEAAVTCGINSSGLFFGSINPLSLAEINSVAIIDINCVGGPVTYTIKLTPGYGTILQRLMKSGLNELKYNIYSSSTYSTILGDGTAGSVMINGASTIDITNETHYAFGKVSGVGLSSTVAGNYSDNISVMIVY